MRPTKLTTIHLFCDIGSAFEDKKKKGISHFLEHMLFKGTRGYTSEELLYELDAKGGKINAYTTKRYTCFKMQMESIYFKEYIHLLSEITLHSLICEKKLGSIVRVVRSENESDEQNFTKNLYLAFANSAFLGSSFQDPVDSLQYHNQFSYADLKKWYAQFYQPQNLVMSIVSSIPQSTCKSILMDSSFCKNKNTSAKMPMRYNPPYQSDSPHYILKTYSGCFTTHLRVGFRIHNQYSEDKYLFQVLCQSLNNLSGRFFLKVREEYGLTYRTFSEIELEETSGFFSVQCEMNPKYLLATFTIVVQILNGLVEEGITSKELQAAQQHLHTNWVSDGEDNDALSKYNGEQLFLFSNNLLPHANLYEKYKVKKDDLNRIIHQYFLRKNFIVSIVSEKELNLLAVEKVGNGFQKISP